MNVRMVSSPTPLLVETNFRVRITQGNSKKGTTIQTTGTPKTAEPSTPNPEVLRVALL